MTNTDNPHEPTADPNRYLMAEDITLEDYQAARDADIDLERHRDRLEVAHVVAALAPPTGLSTYEIVAVTGLSRIRVTAALVLLRANGDILADNPENPDRPRWVPARSGVRLAPLVG